jgi:hypothetical protein
LSRCTPFSYYFYLIPGGYRFRLFSCNVVLACFFWCVLPTTFHAICSWQIIGFLEQATANNTPAFWTAENATLSQPTGNSTLAYNIGSIYNALNLATYCRLSLEVLASLFLPLSLGQMLNESEKIVQREGFTLSSKYILVLVLTTGSQLPLLSSL